MEETPACRALASCLVVAGFATGTNPWSLPYARVFRQLFQMLKHAYSNFVCGNLFLLVRVAREAVYSISVSIEMPNINR